MTPSSTAPSTRPLAERGEASERLRRVLFISYDGMTDPLGRSQVLPYLIGLARRGHRICLLSCEKPSVPDSEWDRVRSHCLQAGIEWKALPYHRRPPLLSTLRDVRAIKRAAAQLHRRRDFEIVHCRSYIPALVGLWMKRRLGTRLLFDMRGFWADEKAEGGSWPGTNPIFRLVYRYFKSREKAFLSEADGIVSLTRSARDEIAAWPSGGRSADDITVIPCCVDFAHFGAPSAAKRAAARSELGIEQDRPVVAYVGSLGGNYLLEEMLRFFLAFRELRPGALFLFITQSDPYEILEPARELEISSEELLIRAANRDEVPRFTGAADVGVAFKQPSYSAKACSPTKLGEMLALGIPVVANAGVGDVEDVLTESGAGVVVNRFDEPTMRAAADSVLRLGLRPEQIREAARRWFELEDGVAEYSALYQRMR